MGLKVLTLKQWILSHALLVAGLILITIGLLQGGMVLNVIGIWAFTLGLCLLLGFSFARVISK